MSERKEMDYTERNREYEKRKESQSECISVEKQTPANQENNSSIDKQELQNTVANSEKGILSDPITINAKVGTRIVLSCFNTSLALLTILTWKVELWDGYYCLLSFRTDSNNTFNNCSTMTWNSRPDLNSSLHIDPVELTNEGNYTCETATVEGNFNKITIVSVLVPPVVSLTRDSSGGALCQASAGKPAAWISWSPGSSEHTETKQHTNGTVTVTSRYRTSNMNETDVTCTVSHPMFSQSWNQSIVLSGTSSHTALYAGISSGASIIIIIGTFLGLFLLHKQVGLRKCCRSTSPDVTLSYAQENVQDDEVEPYASYVEKANVIYNCVSELSE
ncbi:cell surface glycoprotein CD200 receptor 1-A-like isoform X2 [Rhinatrema bivittatum]|uniref:cell surface glycoprotein CD200 receptor 1-A-like isoform X2 n=1 Tax=Rhinatrema bivittatum TaxID=194408 RepID=UPI0011263714|nr:cell surface glycoprotein CD200 receptor 1-A-like isoform X2 [Rhinatrema bivittatum]